MPQIDDAFLFPRRPTAERPLLGQTVLVVEDSRFAGEALRLSCLKGGARIRRADSLRAAARHLASWRPTVALVDLGLPDGSGLDLIAQLARDQPRVPVLLAISGDIDEESVCLAAGADGFLAKPVAPVAALHAAILRHLPPAERPRGPRPPDLADPEPQSEALLDDLAHISDLLCGCEDARTLDYAVRFARSLGRSARDGELTGAAEEVLQRRRDLRITRPQVARLAGLVQNRLSAAAAPEAPVYAAAGSSA
ncbi:response regulator [Rhodobacteraceae bacterium CCMM004]|nr:response regulator [Rhodobacteraceae bacterium CCMM004]